MTPGDISMTPAEEQPPSAPPAAGWAFKAFPRPEEGEMGAALTRGIAPTTRVRTDRVTLGRLHVTN